MLKKTKAVLLSLAVISSSVFAVDYPQWRGEGRRGVFSETNLIDSIPADGPAIKWTAQGIGDGYSSVIAVGDLIYTTGMKDKTATISALDRNTGNIAWQKPYGTSWTEKQYAGERTTPTYDNGKVYVFGPHGQLHCFDALNGNQLWAVDTFANYGGRNITWGVSESVVVEGDMVICTPGGENAALVALNKNTGELIWKSPISDKSAYCSAVVVDYAGFRMLVTMLDKNIYGINVVDGKVLWQVAHKVAYDINAVTPIVDKDIVYVSNGYKLGGKAFKIAPDASSVTELWQDKRLDCQLGGLSYSDGVVYGINLKGNIVALELTTGRVIAISEPFVGKGALIMADGKLFCYGESGKVGIVAFDGSSFTLAGSFEVTQGEKEHWAHPVIAQGVLYIRHGDCLMAYNVSAK